MVAICGHKEDEDGKPACALDLCKRRLHNRCARLFETKSRPRHVRFLDNWALSGDDKEQQTALPAPYARRQADATSIHQEESAGQKAVEQVLLAYGLLEIVGDLSPDFQAQIR